MQYPFFRRQYTNPSPRPYSTPASSGQRRPKVVSIPVHFVDSEMSRSTAVIRIQKAFRGFVVRRNVNKISGIKKQVDEMEAQLSLEETVDLVRKDTKERLKVNETLMSLLLRLDTVGSFDSGVRDLRKSVIKKVIVLQEKLDAITSAGLNKMEEVAEEAIDPIEEVEDVVDGPMEEIKYPIEVTENQNSQEDGDPGRIGEENDKKEFCNLVKQAEGPKSEREREGDEIDERKEVMEKMMEKNEILIGMVKELCEKNKMQTEIIKSLSRRVDGLEKAFKRSKSKKRKQSTTARGGSDNKKL